MNAFNSLNQILLISWMNLRNIRQRLGASCVALVGVAGVVAVFIGVLSMATGFQRTMMSGGSDDIAIIMRSGANSEMTSGMGFDQAQWIAQSPGVKRENGEPLASPELVVIVDLPKRATGTSANVPMRGVRAGAFLVHENLRIVEGRKFETGRNELIVGRGARHQFAGLDLGAAVHFGQSEWTVVGIFEANGGVHESEIWCDAPILQDVYRRGNSYQSVRVVLEDSGTALEELRTAIAGDPRLDMDVTPETEYLAAQSEPLSQFIYAVGYPLAVIMALGAMFGALNTMYSSVTARTREIATLRAIGFGGLPVACSTVLEALVLALAGGLLGSALVYLLFHGYTVSTINSASFSQVVFDFAVTAELVVQGLVAALVIGFIGGLLPAIRAARMPVTSALRE